MHRSLVAWVVVVMSVGCVSGGGGETPATDAGRDAIADSAPVTDSVIFPTDDASDDGAPPSCNGAPLTAWSAPSPLTTVTGVVTSATIVDPYVLPDGLSLLFAANDASGKSRLHLVTRANRSVPFMGGTRIPGFEGTAWTTVDVGQPAAARLDEILFTTPDNNGDLWVATRAGMTGSVTARRYTETFLNTMDIDGSPTITADGERMVIARSTPGSPYGLYEATRLTTTPGSSWIGVSPLTTLNNPSYHVLCPALSPDGLTLYFATNAEAPMSLATTIFVTQRSSRTTAFGTPVPVAALTVAGKFNCPRSVTADGCEMYLSNESSGKLTAYSAKRSM